MNGNRLIPLIVALFSCNLPLCGQAADYNPLQIPSGWKAELADVVVEDSERMREIPLRIFLPASDEPAPVVLFSHGLGGSNKGNSYLGQHWSGRGFVAVFMQHAGSDEAVWKNAPRAKRISALRKAANRTNARLRIQDVSKVIDQLDRWHRSDPSPLHGRLDLARLGMSGHSFGAITTQAVSGQRTTRGSVEKRIRAAIAMSPSMPAGASNPKTVFENVHIPWLLMTGTEDVSRVGNADVKSRLAVFPALPPGEKYELVLHGGKHEAFGDRDLIGARRTRNPNHHRVILALSTAFWEAHLRGHAEAGEWLDGNGPASVLEPQDRWQRK